MRNLTIERQRVDALTPYAQNARTHSKKQIRQIADSIKKFGWTNPILVDGAGVVVAGHGRIEAAKLLGVKTVPTMRMIPPTSCLRSMTVRQSRARAISGVSASTV